MKVIRVAMLADDYAVVHLRPSWFARLFGARDVMCELVHLPHGTNTSYGTSLTGRGWHCKRTMTHIGWMPHSRILLHALQFSPVDPDDKNVLPPARLLEKQK